MLRAKQTKFFQKNFDVSAHGVGHDSDALLERDDRDDDSDETGSPEARQLVDLHHLTLPSGHHGCDGCDAFQVISFSSVDIKTLPNSSSTSYAMFKLISFLFF